MQVKKIKRAKKRERERERRNLDRTGVFGQRMDDSIEGWKD